MAEPTLLIVDVQKAWDDPALGQRNNDPSAEENVARLLQAWRTAEAPTWYVGDACSTYDREGPDSEVFPAELVHRTALASVHGEFADVITTDEAIKRLGSI